MIPKPADFRYLLASMRLVRSTAAACRSLALAAIGALLPCVAAWAQTNEPSNASPTLVAFDQSIRQQSYTVEQVRRFFDAKGGVTSVRERLQVAANGSSAPDFAMTFLGVVGEPAGSALHTQWQQTYARHGRRFATQGSFRVTNLDSADSNYTAHDFGPTVRAGRSARRFVVFPNAIDKSIWLIETDDATAVPLYVAEFDVHVRLLAEVEATLFTPGAATLAPQATTAAVVADFQAARTAMGNPPELVDPPTGVTGEYQLDRVEVQNDPLNGQWKLTMTYTDGIDQFVVVQAPGTTDSFATLPGKTRGAPVIGRYRDAAMSVLVFWEGGVSFQVAGRGSLQRLDALARTIYRQALHTH